MICAVLTISDRVSRGESEDKSGPELIASITQNIVGVEEVLMRTVPDEIPLIREALQVWVSREVNMVITTGGTGFTPRDVTPEATKSIIQKECPGLVFAMMQESLRCTPLGMLSRGTAGISGKTLIINMPGSVKAVRENFNAILPALPHALRLIREQDMDNHAS